MAEFDDLVPTITAGEFDDLIPSGGGEFDDLIPKHDAKESWKWGEPFRPGYGTEVARGLTQPVPGMVKTASIIGEELLDRPAFGVGPSGRDILRKIGVDTQPDAVPESRPLYKLGEWMQDKIDAGYPAMPEPERNLGHDVASGLGQVASMVTGGVAAKAAGATLKGAALVGTALGFGQEFDDAFTRARQRGDDPDTAFAKSFGYATVASLIENKLGAGRIIRKYFPDPAEAAKKLSAWGISKATAISLAVGFGEEGSQRFAQNWIVEGKPSLEGIVQEGAPGGIVQAIAELPAHLLRGRGKIRRAPISRLTPPLITEQQEIENAQIETPVEMGETQPPRSIQGVAARVASEIPQPAVAPPAKEAAGAGVTAEVTPIPPPAPRQLLGGSLFTDTMLRQEYRELRKRLGGGIEYIENPVTRENAIHNLESQDPNRAKAARRYVELHDAISELAPQAPATPTIKPAPIDTSLIASVVLPKIAPVVFKSLDPMNPAIGWFELTSPFTVPETGRVIQPGPGAMLNSSQIEKYGMSLEGPAKTAFEEAKKRPSVNAQRSPAGVGVPAPVSGGTAPAPAGKLPPVKPGFVRMYHGGADPTGELSGDRDITAYYDYAKGYADRNNYPVWYVDVPENAPFMNLDEGASSETRKYWVNTKAPADVMLNAKPATQPETKPVAPVEKPTLPQTTAEAIELGRVAFMAGKKRVVPPELLTKERWIAERWYQGWDKANIASPVAEPKKGTARAPITRLPSKWKSIGKNSEGQEVFEDDNGVRSYVEGNVRVTQPVRMIPTREGIQTGTGEPGPEFTPVTLEKPTAIKPKAETMPRIDEINRRLLQIEQERAAPSATAEYLKALSKEMSALESETKLSDIRAKREEIKARLIKKLGQTNLGVDPEVATIAAELAVNYTQEGVVKFSDFARRVKAELPEIWQALKQYLRGAWATAADINDNLDDISRAEAKSVLDRIDTETTKTESEPSERPIPERQPSPPISDVETPPSGGPTGTARGGRMVSDQPEASEGVGSGRQPVPESAGGERPSGGSEPTGGGGRSEPSGATRGQRTVRGAKQPVDKNYVITDADKLGQGTPKSKAAGNLAAISLVKRLESEGRLPTAEEKAVLVKYVGWGGIKGIFVEDNDQFSRERAELKELLTPEEFAAARASIQDAHYTSQTVISRGIYAAMQRLGFTGGKMVEGGVGIGNFIGLMPAEWRDKSSYIGIERDPLTAKIAQYLYPEARIQERGYQDADLARDSFDGAASNPPFGDKAIYDKNFKASSKHSIHNYFIGKTLELTRPGGVNAFVVSRYFLDAADPSAKEHIATLGEFLGAIRLPNTAFKENANTEVVTDLVFFKRVPEGTNTDTDWTKVVTFKDPKSGLSWKVNSWIAAHPEMILGEMTQAKHGLYSKEEMSVEPRPNQDLGADLDKAVENLPQNVYEPTTRSASERLTTPELVMPEGVKVGGFYIQDGHLLRRLPDVNGERQRVPAFLKEGAADRVKAIIPIRDALNRLVKAELAPDSSETTIAVERTSLNRVYDSFVKRFGFLNSSTNRRAFYDDADSMRVLGLERDYASGISPATAKKKGVEAIAPTAKKADIFTKRVNAPYREVTSVETPKEALMVSLNQRGGVDLDYMAELTGKDRDTVLAQLEGLVFETPTGTYESKEQYLSGNVRQKLKDAQEAGDKFAKNVEALTAVIPKDIDPTDIIAPIGAPWIEARDVAAFAEELTDSPPSAVLYQKANAGWLFTHNDRSTASVQTWGTPRMPFGDMMKLLLNGKPVIVYDWIDAGDGKEQKVINQADTELANAKASELKDKWQEWVWSNKDRRDRLHRIYNDTYNNYVDFKADGSHLTLPGASPIITLNPHQKNVVWRTITTGGDGLLYDQVVGSGKTFAAIGAMMEMNRLGRVHKWLVTVPNHLTGQWADSFNILYPNANILAAKPSDFTKENRQKLFSKILTGDYDAVVLGHSSLKKVGTSPEVEKGILTELLDEIVQTIQAMKTAEGTAGQKRGSRAVAQMEKTKDNIKAKIDKLSDIGGRDAVAMFEELGFDGLVVDEAHEFKNLFYTTQMQNVAGLGTPAGSAKAFDLYLKTRYLRNQFGGKAPIAFLTGTPISNSLVEMFTMQRYLQPKVLADMGLKTLDAWARVFADVRPVYEVDPTGTGYRMATRLANFQNVGELTAIYRNMADVVTMDDLQAQAEAAGKRFPVPKVQGGKPDNIVADRTPEQAEYFGIETQVLDAEGKPSFDTEGNPVMAYPAGTILWRVDNMPDDPREDNMLKLTSDARKAGLDMRLVNPASPDRPESKINRAVLEIARIHKLWNEQKGTQLVFCDLSVPASARGRATAKATIVGIADESVAQPEIQIADEAEDIGEQGVSIDELMADQSPFSVYDDMKAKLIKAGIPESQIAFIHDFDTPEKKMKLFKSVNAGDVRVLFGSTPKMGAGTNVQRRIVALHHMDAPWRPSDLEQREGRAIRQGNLFYEEAMQGYASPQDYEKDPKAFALEIKRYATRLTYDTRMWQLIEHKAAGIDGFRKADRSTRRIDDFGGEAANASDMKAAASGDPMIQQELQLRNDLNKLQLLKKAWDRNRIELQNREAYLRDYEKRYQSKIHDLDNRKAFLEAHTPKDEKGKEVFSFTMPDGKATNEKGVPLSYVADMLKEGKRGYFGEYRGYDFSFEPIEQAINLAGDRVKSVTFYLGKNAYSYNHRVTSFVGDEKLTGVGLFQRLDNYLEPSPLSWSGAESARDREKAQLEEVRAESAKVFPKEEQLSKLRTEHESVRSQLMNKKRSRVAAKPEVGDSRVTVKSPSGTEAIRATMADGTERVIPLAEFEANPVTDATKLEPVARDRRGDWQPVKGEVTLTEQQPDNPHTSPESEANSERARRLKAEERVVQTEQEALDEINRKREASGEEPLKSANLEHGVAGYYFDGVIYYILDGIHSPEQFLAVQREEIAHHINSSPEAKKVLAELGRAPEFELERREIRGSYPKVGSETADQYSERIANEMLAKSRVQDRGLFQRMMDWLIEKLSGLPRIGDWIRESAANRQAILRTISRRLEVNFTAAGKTDVPLAAMTNTQVQGAPVGVEREQENIEAIQKIIRADIFDGTQPITEAATEDARTLFNRLTDPAGKSAATGEILSKTNAQMGPGLVLAELWRYAEEMVINNSDDWLLRQIVPRYQDFDLGGGGPTAYGRGLRALQETDTLFRQLLEIQREKHKAAGDKMSVGQELLNELIEALRTVTPDAAEIEADFDATAGVKPPKGLKSLIESIRTSPYADQSDPAWRRETAIQWFLSAGLSREQAELAAVKFQAAFDKAFAKALAREARAVLGKKTPPAKIEEIVRAIRAGVTDPATALVDHFAKEAGFNPATPTQHKRLVELDQIVADRDLSLPERHIAIGEMNGIFRQMKLPPTVMTKLSANFVATLLTGLRTLTVNIFAPATHLLTERVLLSATNPRDLLTHWKALAGGWSNWLREAQFTATEDVMTYLNDDFRGATNVLKRMWEDGVRDMRSGNPKQQAKGLWQLLSGSQQYAMRMLNAADQANMRAESEAMLVLYGSDVLRQAGFGTKEVEMMVKAVPRIKNELIQQGLDQGMSPKLARVRADSLLAEKLREFIKDDISELAGDEFSQAVNAAELEGYNITGRLGIETDTRDPLKETDEGGMLSRLILHHVLEWSSKMRSKPGSGPAVAVALLGYLNVPLRTARFYAWNSGYGLIRLGIHAFRKRQGWDNWWKQSLSNELQERHRLKMAVAATVAQAIIVGVGFALLKGSDDDDAGEDKLGVYVTGDGPKNKNLKDAWTRRGFQAQSIVMFVAGKPIRVPLTRLGEPLAHIFWPLSALDDWRWRKKEAEASGRPFAEPPSETVMRSIGTYAGLLGQRGPLQSVTQWAKVGSGEGGTAKILAQQTSRVVSAAVTPWLGLQSSASAMIYGPIDQTSISAAIYASMPILGLFGERFRKQQVNRFGDPLYDQSWYAKMSQTGVPIAFRVANTPENQKVYSLLTEKGAAPPVLRRYILEERFGPLTNKQFEQFSETSGRRLKQEVSSNQAALRDMSPEAAKNWLNKTTTRVDRQTELDMGLQRVKPLKVSGGGGYSILGAASTPRTVGGTIGRSRSRPVSFGRSRRRRTSLRGYSTRGRSRIRRPRLARIGRSRVRRARLYASRVRRPRLSFA